MSTSFTDKFELRYRILDDRLPDPDDVPVFNYIEQVNRLNASATAGDLTLELQVDEVALFANQYYLDGVLYSERNLLGEDMFAPFATTGGDGLNRYGYATLEKARARIEKDAYTLVIGDAYAAFGRGIALNLNRNVDIDIDTSIQGVKLVARPGAWDITAVAGQANRQQVFQDNPNVDIIGDHRHFIGGLRAERFGLGPANVGAHTVVYNFTDDNGWIAGGSELSTAPDAVVGGATLELTGVGGIDWYGEADVFGFIPDQCAGAGNCATTYELPASLGEDTAGDPGLAAYVSAAFYPGKTTWLIEGKRYYQAERVNALLAPEFYEVAVAPTLEYERAINEDTASAMNSNDIWGARVRMDYAAKPGELIPYAQVAVFRDVDLGGVHFNETPETIAHGVVGVEYIKHEGAALANVGYRRDQRDSDPDAAPNCDLDRNQYRCFPGADQQIHGDASIKFPFVAGLLAELQTDFELWMWGVNEFQQADFFEATNGFTVQKGSDVAVTLFSDYSTNPLVSSTGNLPLTVDVNVPAQPVFGAPASTIEKKPLYGAVEVQVKPTSALTIKAFYGAYKAGIRCSGGQCRQLPGFEGGRVSVQGAF